MGDERPGLFSVYGARFLGEISADRIFIGIKLMKKYLPVFFIILLSGCADPLPEDRLDYVGEWRSNEMGLLILADGSVSYKRLKGGATTSVSGPLKRFEGDNFVVGVFHDYHIRRHGAAA